MQLLAPCFAARQQVRGERGVGQQFRQRQQHMGISGIISRTRRSSIARQLAEILQRGPPQTPLKNRPKPPENTSLTPKIVAQKPPKTAPQTYYNRPKPPLNSPPST
jgi:hypothetical protein